MSALQSPERDLDWRRVVKQAYDVVAPPDPAYTGSIGRGFLVVGAVTGVGLALVWLRCVAQRLDKRRAVVAQRLVVIVAPQLAWHAFGSARRTAHGDAVCSASLGSMFPRQALARAWACCRTWRTCAPVRSSHLCRRGVQPSFVQICQRPALVVMPLSPGADLWLGGQGSSSPSDPLPCSVHRNAGDDCFSCTRPWGWLGTRAPWFHLLMGKPMG